MGIAVRPDRTPLAPLLLPPPVIADYESGLPYLAVGFFGLDLIAWSVSDTSESQSTTEADVQNLED